MLANLLGAIDGSADGQEEEPPEMADEGAESHGYTGGQGKRDAQADKKVGENRHHPLEQRAHDQRGEGDDGDG
jgi:hypothetical protein